MRWFWLSIKFGLVIPAVMVGLPLLLALFGVQDLINYVNGEGWGYAVTSAVFLSWAIWDFVQLPELVRDVRRWERLERGA